MPPNMMLEFYLHAKSRQIKPRYVRVELKPGEIYLIEADPYPESLSIRRATRYEVSMREETANFYHCLVWADDDKVKIRDLGSVEGTYVNKLNINRDAFELKDGDVICFGRVPPKSTADDLMRAEVERIIVRVKIIPPRFYDGTRQSWASLADENADLRFLNRHFCSIQ